MFAAIVGLFVLMAQAGLEVKHFHKIDKAAVPRSIIESAALCNETSKNQCWSAFLDLGGAWAGDVNDDGVDEFVVFPGLGWSGSAGDWYFLFQKQGNKWVPVYSEAKDIGWQTLYPLFDILPIVRGGYHDLRVDAAWCLKWNGRNYVSYRDADYHQLPPELFDKSNLDDAEILWSIRYRGVKQAQFEPQWFPNFAAHKNSVAVRVDDPGENLIWIALFKGGIWGVRGDRAFLLLPQPAYRGSEKMELQGDYLIVYGEFDDPSKAKSPPIVARYNRLTHELRVKQ
jgi:hypothetical protein